MFKGLGSGVEVYVEAGASIEVEMGDEGGTEGGLRAASCQWLGWPRELQRVEISPAGGASAEGIKKGTGLTFPAPAGPMTMTPNLLILMAMGSLSGPVVVGVEEL